MYDKGRGVDLAQFQRNRLFAKDVLSRRCRLNDQIGVRIGGRTDQDGVNIGVSENFFA